jgi:hypothetical protein
MSLIHMTGRPEQYMTGEQGGLHAGSVFGYGVDQDYIKNLNKALEAKSVVDIATDTQQFGATQLHSMDAVMKNLSYGEDRLTFWNMIPKSGARQLIEQYTQILGWGQGNGFTSQAGMPIEADIEWGHAYEEVRFVRHVWKANDVVDMVASITQGVSSNKRAAGMRVLRDINIGLYIADNSANPYEFNGMYRMLLDKAPQNIIDVAGEVPTRVTLDTMMQQLSDQEANVENTYMCASSGGISTMALVYGQSADTDFTRSIVSRDGQQIVPGYDFRKFSTMHGMVNIERDIFIAKAHERRTVPKRRDPNDRSKNIEGPESEDGAPATPTLTATAIDGATYTSATGKIAKFSSTHARPSGVKYKYRVSAGNTTGGRSQAAVAVEVNVNVIDGGAVQIDITRGTGGPSPDYYEVFSTALSGGTEYYSIGRVRANASGVTTFYDANHVVPGTTVLYFMTHGQGEEATMSFKLLAPMYNKTLAPIGMFSWGVVNLYGMPLWYAPQKLGMVINVPVDSSVENARLIL